jgi:myo-inositol 2-dehydrogenase/D-chiro-inositol 1-dehydrogenase
MMGQEHILNLALIPDTEVIAVAEPNSDMQRRCRKLLPDAEIVSCLADLLKIKDVDALVIATPNYQHAAQLLKLFELTSLPILIEKPLVTEKSDVQRILVAAEKHSAPVWVAMEYRYMPPLVQFIKQLDKIGELQSLSIREHRFPFLKKVDNWNRFNRNSGGTLVEKCCHFFDLYRLIMKEEVNSIYASAGQNHNHLHEQYDGETPDIIDNAFVTMEFASNRRALLDLNMFAEGSMYQEEICAIGRDAKLECLIPGPAFNWPKDRPQPEPQVILSPRKPRGPSAETVLVEEALLKAGAHHGSTYYEHVGFKHAVCADGPVDVTVEDGLKAVVLGLAAQASATNRRVVEILDQGLDFRIAT